MQHRIRCLGVVLIMAALLLAACTPKPPATTYDPPAKVEPIPGENFHRVTLTVKAAERIALQTVPVREEQVVRKRAVGGVVVVPATDPGKASVRVPLIGSELDSVDMSKTARILPLTGSEKELATARAILTLAGSVPLQYAVDGAVPGLKEGDRVRVEVPLKTNSGLRKIVPHSAVVYDTKGQAWVYMNPEPLVFVRHAVTVSFFDVEETTLTTNDIHAATSIEDFLVAYGGRGRAVLLEGPPVGTQIVTVGAIELFGAETGIGK
jgi:hypothetical protein